MDYIDQITTDAGEVLAALKPGFTLEARTLVVGGQPLVANLIVPVVAEPEPVIVSGPLP